MDQPKKKIIINKVSNDAHWNWMLKGLDTFRKSFIPSIATVSYTHLDVYKRQGLSFIF